MFMPWILNSQFPIDVGRVLNVVYVWIINSVKLYKLKLKNITTVASFRKYRLVLNITSTESNVIGKVNIALRHINTKVKKTLPCIYVSTREGTVVSGRVEFHWISKLRISNSFLLIKTSSSLQYTLISVTRVQINNDHFAASHSCNTCKNMAWYRNITSQGIFSYPVKRRHSLLYYLRMSSPIITAGKNSFRYYCFGTQLNLTISLWNVKSNPVPEKT